MRACVRVFAVCVRACVCLLYVSVCVYIYVCLCIPLRKLAGTGRKPEQDYNRLHCGSAV